MKIMATQQPITIFWFRRDLRLHDNAGLYHALKSGNPVLPVFIFDRNILDKLEDKSDQRVTFIYHAIESLQAKLTAMGSTLHCYYDTPEMAFEKLSNEYKIAAVYCNHDYEGYAIERDIKISVQFNQKNISFHSFKDQVIFEKNEVIKDDGTPYTVFTPYSRKWKATLTPFHTRPYPVEKYTAQFLPSKTIHIPSLNSMGFKEVAKPFPSLEADKLLISKYAKQRDIPGIRGTSRLGIHLRFGTISIRQLARFSMPLSETYLNELIWRDFYQMITWHFPHINKGNAFKPAYDRIEWRKDNGEFKKWCNGETGYPIVDAGMRELNNTGFMHNRVRMIVASFLCKHLLLDWRLGEAYFAEKLLDFDFAANNGGWQWAAGSGCDAAPYFRIFNPYLQTKKFDPDFTYIKKWVPEFQEFTYPKPIVDHEMARKRCLEVYSRALKPNAG